MYAFNSAAIFYPGHPYIESTTVLSDTSYPLSTRAGGYYLIIGIGMESGVCDIGGSHVRNQMTVTRSETS